jgi:hypothetical protein
LSSLDQSDTEIERWRARVDQRVASGPVRRDACDWTRLTFLRPQLAPAMGLFDGVSYKLIPAPDPLYTQQLANLLNTNGGIPADTLEEATHVISDSDRFDGWEKVPSDIPVVTVSRVLYISRVRHV